MRGMTTRTCSIALACLAIVWSAGAGAAEGYQLGPRDKVRVRVYDWRQAVSDTHEWKALNGEYRVSASGMLSIPILGEVPANGRTTSELADEISELLRSKIGLTQRPATAVEVDEYRPFYILGQVTTPGEYAFRPNLTVVQAVSIAGGIRRLDLNAFGLLRDGLSSRGDLRALAAERLSLVARQARLSAELNDSPEIAFPKEILDQAASPDVERIVREEKLLMQSRATELQSKAENLTQTGILLTNEVKTLQAKAVALQRQEEIAKRELDTVNGLVAKGLAVTARQSALDQTVSQYASNRVDVDLMILRAKQDIAKIARDKADLQNKQRSEALTELANVRTKIAIISEKMQTSQAVVSSLALQDAHLAASTANDGRKLGYRITRQVGGNWVTTEVSDNDPVAPGDTVRVEWDAPAANTRESHSQQSDLVSR